MMQLGADGVFVGSGIFKSGDPAQRAAAIVKATTFFDDADGHRRGVARTRRGDGRHQRLRPRRTAPPRRAWLVARAGSPRCDAGRRPRPPGRLPRARCAFCASLGADVVPVRRPERTRRGRRPRDPGRRVERDGQAQPHLRARRAAARRASRDGMPVYGTCAGLIMLADTVLDAIEGQQTPRRPRRRRAAQRLRLPARLVRDRPRHPGARRPAGARRLHPRARRRDGRARASRSSPRSPTAASSPSSRATCSARRSTPR